MNKKLMSSVLAGAMAISTLSVAASAATATDKTVTAAGSTTFKVSATVAEAIIDVTIPSSMSAVVNPYGISVTTKTGVYGATGFTSPVYTIKNNTQTSAVMVSATPTITVPTTSVKDPDTKVTTKVPTIAVVATKEEIADKEASKDKAIYAYVAGVDGTNVATDASPTALNVHDDEGAMNGSATVAVFEDATTDEKGATHTKSDILLIPAATKETAAVPDSTPGAGDGTPAAPATYGYGQIQMGGEVTNTNITPWTKSDKITINLVLDIAPCKSDATKGVYGNVVDDEEGGEFTDPTSLAGAVTAGTTGASNVVRTGDNTYTADLSQAALGSVTAITNVFNIPLATDWTISKVEVKEGDTTVVQASGTNMKVNAATGERTLVVTLADNNMVAADQTIEITVTATA